MFKKESNWWKVFVLLFNLANTSLDPCASLAESMSLHFFQWPDQDWTNQGNMLLEYFFIYILCLAHFFIDLIFNLVDFLKFLEAEQFMVFLLSHDSDGSFQQWAQDETASKGKDLICNMGAKSSNPFSFFICTEKSPDNSWNLQTKDDNFWKALYCFLWSVFPHWEHFNTAIQMSLPWTKFIS